MGQRGRIALDFTREADSALEAMTSAIRAVNEAIPGATLNLARLSEPVLQIQRRQGFTIHHADKASLVIQFVDLLQRFV